MISGKMDSVLYVRAWVHWGERDLSQASDIARQCYRNVTDIVI